MIDTIVIPAAGRGTRMKKLALHKPKHLINVFGKPFIFYLLRRIKQAGYRRIIIVTGNHSGAFKDFAEQEGKSFGLELIDQFDALGREHYGTAIPIIAAEKLIGSMPFVCVMGDNLYGVRDLQSARENAGHAIYGLHSKYPERYGVLEADSAGTLINIHEKAESPITDVINTGLYTFFPSIFPAVRAVQRSKRGEYELTDAVRALAKTEGVALRLCQDPWLDFGRLPDIPRVANFLKKSGEI